MNKNSLSIGIILLIIISAINPLSFGFNAKTSIVSNNGNTLYVGGNGPGNYSKIQDAIDNASEGDTVYVFNGTYYGHIYVNKSINILGENKNSTFIIGYVAFTISIVSDWVNFSGFTIQNDERLGEGIRIDSCYNNFFNNLIEIPNDNIRLSGDYNTITGNIIKSDSIILSGDRNVIYENSIINDIHGIHFYNSHFNIISYNTFLNCGLSISEDNGGTNIIMNNTVNYKPLIYLTDESNYVIDDKAGQIILVNCTNITIKNQDIFKTTIGVQLWNSNSCVIINNTFADNLYGIYLNQYCNKNKIYRNNLFYNVNNAIDQNENFWDNGKSGNFWSDYDGEDKDDNGIGDKPYPIPGSDNEDRYPIGNFKPKIPVIDGKKMFKEGEGGEYEYKIYSIDPEGEAIYYKINWSDGVQEWIGPLESGEKFTINVKIPLEKGTYTLFRVKVIDFYGAESDWVKLVINVLRDKSTSFSSLFRFLERYPLLNLLFQKLTIVL